MREPTQVPSDVLATALQFSALSLASVVLSYDAWAVASNARGDAMTELTIAWAWRCQTASWLWGVVAGHLLWPTFERRMRVRRQRVSALWAFGFVVALGDFFVFGSVLPLWPIAVGVLAGHALWPHEKRSDLDG